MIQENGSKAILSLSLESFDAKGVPCSGRSITKKVGKITPEVKRDRHVSSYDIAKKLNIHHHIMVSRLKKAGYKKARLV